MIAQPWLTTASNTKNGSCFEVFRDMDTGCVDDMDHVQDIAVPGDERGT